MERFIAVNNVMCIQFRPKEPSDLYFITFVSGDGCSSYVSRFRITGRLNSLAGSFYDFRSDKTVDSICQDPLHWNIRIALLRELLCMNCYIH